MATLNLMDVGFARWKIWSVELRDEGSCYSEDAELLCRLFDMYETLSRRAAAPDSAGNLADGLRSCIEQLIGRLLTAGAEPPKEAAVLK